MTKADFLARLEYFQLVHCVTMRAIDLLENKDLDFRPANSTRTPRELIFHMYAQEKVIAEAIRDGSFTIDAAGASSPEADLARLPLAALATARELKEYARQCHQLAEGILQALPEEKIAGPVESPMGTYPGWRFFEFAYDEHWHHRGQFYTYLRLLGKEPPMLYGY